MLVSVMMPAYNAARYVEQALRSLLAEQGDFQLDIIVVDDGSSDDTAQITQKMAEQYPQIRLFAATHGGIARTRNRAIDALTDDTEFVTFLDADDLVFPGRIARQLKLLLANPDADVVYGLLQWFDELDETTLRPSATARTQTQLTTQLSVALFRRSVIDRTGRFDESLLQSEDTDYLLRVAESGVRVIMEQEVATYYRRHDANVTNDRALVKREFMRAIHRSIRRRQTSACKASAAFGGKNLIQNSNLLELFNVCPNPIPS